MQKEIYRNNFFVQRVTVTVLQIKKGTMLHLE